MKRIAPILLGVFCVILFMSGLVRLFHLRFEHGDVYPAYSSLRADPLGSMAFYESLERTPGLTVRRDYSGKDELPEARATTYLHLAGDVNDWNWMPLELVTEIESFLAGGGRLVVTLAPVNSSWSIWKRVRPYVNPLWHLRCARLLRQRAWPLARLIPEDDQPHFPFVVSSHMEGRP